MVGDDVVVSGATIDSRSVAGGELFVPIVAARDGHDFIGDAARGGAAAYLTARGPVDTAAAITAVAVADTAAALLEAGALARARLTGPVVAITGSVGKTTVKDLAAAALESMGPVAASARSFNNELGVPLTLLNAGDDTRVAVVEMGARGPGHIALLCRVARPTVGVVTSVVPAHTELFGSLEAVAVAKGELVEALPASGTAVLNADAPLVAAMAARATATVVTFGVDGGDVRAEGVALDDELRPSFRLVSAWGNAEVRLGVHGAHQVTNALAAAAAALVCGVAVDPVAAGLGAARLSRWRMELVRAPSGARILNDAYNANPTSMQAALRALAALPGENRIAVLGIMAELGAERAAEHRRVGDLARAWGIRVVAVATDMYGGEVVDDVAGAVEAVGAVGPDDVVLVKASRVVGLEAVAERLATRR